MHSVGVLHGDIKAHNVMRRDGGQIVLVDFGAGRPLAAEPRKGNDLIGTPVYMAPEVLNGQPRSAASDIYSLGVLLFHLVTNDYPVYATSQAAFIDAHTTGARKRLRDIRPDLPDGFIHLVERATAALPQSRFSSAGALETELVHLLAPPEPVPAPSTNHNWRLWVGGVSAIAILSMGVAFWGTSRAPGTTAGTAAVASRPAETDVPLRADSYAIEAAFYRMNGAAGRELLGAGQSVKVNDELSLSVSTSAPTYLYVVNEDEHDEAYLLFPLPGQTLTNPLPANQEVRVPAGYNWQVSSAGRERALSRLRQQGAPLGLRRCVSTAAGAARWRFRTEPAVAACDDREFPRPPRRRRVDDNRARPVDSRGQVPHAVHAAPQRT